MTSRSFYIRIVALGTLALVASCTSNTSKDGPPKSGSSAIGRLPDDAIPRREPRGRYGNGPVYEVFGKRYTVMNSSSGYKEQGVASWYGKKFHGNLTSMREPYDMYAMTAAHKTLPLPTYVRVRNLSNNKSVVVRVNDRGPFVHNRIIDLSYSAALKLGIVRNGTGLVEVEAISLDGPSGDRPTRQVSAGPGPARESTPATAAPQAAATKATAAVSNAVFAQVGAFGSRDNADRRLAAIRSGGIGTGFVVEDGAVTPPIFRVRIGPIRSVEQYDLLVAELEKLGIEDPYLVAE